MAEIGMKYVVLYRDWNMLLSRLWFDNVAVQLCHTLINALIQDKNFEVYLLTRLVQLMTPEAIN